MKIGSWAKLLLLGAPLLAGCANFWQAPSSSSGGSTSTLQSGIFYVLNQSTAQIAGYYMNAGTLTPISGSPVTLASAPFSIAVAPNGLFLYVGTESGIYVYTIGSGGVLTAGSSSAIFSDQTPYALAVYQNSAGSWLLDASAGGAVYGIPVDSSTGVTTSSNYTKTTISGTEAQQIVISPDNDYVFVTEGLDGTSVIPFNSGNFGTAMSFSVAGMSGVGSAIAVAVDPISSTVTAPRLFYVGEIAALSSGATGGIRVFNYSALAQGKISEVSGSPFSSGGLAPYSILPRSTGDYVYVANRTATSGNTTGNISAFQVTASGSAYTLTALSSSYTITAGTYPVSMAEDSDDNYLLLVNYGTGTSSGGGPDLAGYNFDTTTAGKLDSVLSSSTGTDPVGAIQVVALP